MKLAKFDLEGKRPRLDTEPSNASSASTGSLQQGESSTVSYDPHRYESTNTHSNSPPSSQAFTPPFASHVPPSGFRGEPSASMQHPPFSQPVGSGSSFATTGQLGGMATIETGSHRGAGPFRTQVYPVITAGESREGPRVTALSPIKTEPVVSLPMGSSAANARRSMNTPASFIRKDTTGTSQSASSRSANFSSHGSHGSSAYSPITPIEEGKPLRALPLPPILAAQSSGDSAGSSERSSMYNSPPLASVASPQPVQPGRIPRLQPSLGTHSPSGKQNSHSTNLIYWPRTISIRRKETLILRYAS